MREGGAEAKDVLTWLPRSSKDELQAPGHLKSFQKNWWDNLIWAMFDNHEMQGYLSVTSELWTIAGAHRRDYWDANKSELMSAFSFAQRDGREVMTFPPLLKLIAEQRKKLKMKKSRSPDTNSVGAPLISQSGFDFQNKDSTKSARKECASEARDANPNCTSCRGTGLRASYSSPGKYDACECTAPDSYWRNHRAVGS